MKAAPGRLRDTAEEIARTTGLRVQIIGGTLIAAPPPCGKHAGTVRRLRLRLDRRLPDGLAGYQVSSVGTPEDDEDYATPDLVVLPTDWERSDEWLADPHDVALAVEVASRTERASGTTPGADWYGAAGRRRSAGRRPPQGHLDVLHPPARRGLPGRAERQARGAGAAHRAVHG
ncbi:Uma2 family endonuclease [Kitasatospora sp. cg17-2]